MFIAFETLIKRPRWQSVVSSMFVGIHFPEINERNSFKKLENLWTMVLYIQKVFFFSIYINVFSFVVAQLDRIDRHSIQTTF